jgi:4-amino-4-deoxy-L-arabinose transferase-like glycosyltransferase
MKTNFLWRYKEWVLLLAILLLAIAVRLYQLQNLMIFTYDQGRDMYVLQKIARGDITLIGPTTGLPGVFLGPYMYYLLLPGYILSNGSPFGVVIWQIFLIVLSFPCLYLLLKPLIGKWWSLIALVWISLTPGAIEQARTIWNPSLVVMTLIPSLYALFASKQKPWLLIGSVFLFGLSLQTELAYTFFLGPLYGLWVLKHLQLPEWLQLKLPTKWRTQNQPYNWKVIALSLVAFGLTLLPQVVFELKNNFLITQSVIREMGDASKQVSYQKIWAERPAQIWSEMNDTLTGGAPAASAVTAITFVSAIYVLIQYRKKPEALFFAGYMLLPLAAFMFHRGNYGYFFDYYVTAHYLPAIVVTMLALADIMKRWPRMRYQVGTLVLVLILVLFYRFASVIFNVPLFKYTAATQIAALHHARSLTKGDQPALEVFVPNLIPVAYQYLSEWLSRTDRAVPIDFGGANHAEYVLMYEPAISDGSRVAFDQWYQGWKMGANCTAPTTIGITTIEHCTRPVTPPVTP